MFWGLYADLIVISVNLCSFAYVKKDRNPINVELQVSYSVFLQVNCEYWGANGIISVNMVRERKMEHVFLEFQDTGEKSYQSWLPSCYQCITHFIFLVCEIEEWKTRYNDFFV
jgi:hypothetical protein